ncbi:MAG: CYTH domain-containing protein [Bacteroidales bacterium]|nr:CYTH domain-containing protein [Bacteroidales bacterium]
MGKETERKFLVTGDAYRKMATPVMYHQAFLSTVPERVVRIRIAGEKAYISVKGVVTGFTRMEFEYEIPPDDALFMLDNLCEKPPVKKLRYKIRYGNHVWEVDEFLEENQGLVIAEIELQTEEEIFTKPPWIGREVTGEPQYYNANLVKNPFKNWK